MSSYHDLSVCVCVCVCARACVCVLEGGGCILNKTWEVCVGGERFLVDLVSHNNGIYLGSKRSVRSLHFMGVPC